MTAAESQSSRVHGARVWPLTVPAYRALGELGLIPKNTELLYGTVYHKMAKSPLHCYILTRLLDLVRAALSPGLLLRSEQPIVCDDSEPEPDVSIVRGSAEDFLLDHPHTAELVMEICVTSHEYDRSKLRAYAMANVQEVWFVLGPEKKIEVYRRPMDGQFTEQQVHGSGDRLRSASVPEFEIALDFFPPAVVPQQ